jgi:hypothetical protein
MRYFGAGPWTIHNYQRSVLTTLSDLPTVFPIAYLGRKIAFNPLKVLILVVNHSRLIYGWMCCLRLYRFKDGAKAGIRTALTKCSRRRFRSMTRCRG